MSSSEAQYQLPLYELKKDIPLARAGTIFYYDRDDSTLGSMAAGCLKMAWTREGNCQNSLCADTIVFHASAIYERDWFEPHSVESEERRLLRGLIGQIETEAASVGMIARSPLLERAKKLLGAL